MFQFNSIETLIARNFKKSHKTKSLGLIKNRNITANLRSKEHIEDIIRSILCGMRTILFSLNPDLANLST